MQQEQELSQAIAVALAKLLRPLVRMLLKHSFPYSVLEAIAKRVYVESAMEDFALPGRRPSASRAAILTGLTRKDVNLLLAEPSDRTDIATHHYNRAARVLGAWARAPDFCDAAGQPRVLPMDAADTTARGKSFAELVRLHGGDVPARAVLDELVRVGSVKVRPDGKVELLQREFVPNDSIVPKVQILGTDMRDLMDTITHNIEFGATDPRYQRKVMHVDIPVEVLPAFRKMSAAIAQRALVEMDGWLTNHDIHHLPQSEWPSGITARVGVGIYYIQQIEKTTS